MDGLMAAAAFGGAAALAGAAAYGANGFAGTPINSFSAAIMALTPSYMSCSSIVIDIPSLLLL